MSAVAKLMGGIRDLAQGRSDIFHIDPRQIRIKEGWNCRDPRDPENQQHVESLAISIAEIGVKSPLKVYWENGEPYVADGHCRLAAALLCIERGVELKTVPVMTGGKRGESEADRVAAQLYSSGKPPTPMEQARAVKRLLDLGWKEAEIAAKTGMSVGWVQKLLDFNAAPEEVKALVRDGTVSSSTAMKAVRQGKTGELREAADKAKAEGKKRVKPKDLAPAPATSADTADAMRRAAFEAGWLAHSRATGSPEFLDDMQAEADLFMGYRKTEAV